MGTAISVDIVDAPDGSADALIASTFEWFEDVDRRFSTYKADSEVSRIGRGDLSPGDASADVRHVLDACEDLRLRTGGYFDAYATGQLDPSGYVKGWSVQVASDRLSSVAPNHCINAGGDIRLRGMAPSGSPWRIGISNPFEAHKLAWVLSGTDLAIATSGTYERGLHVIDPFTGRACDYLCSVTVIGHDLGVADAYATAALAMGERGLDWLAGLQAYQSAVITSSGQAFASDGLPRAT